MTDAIGVTQREYIWLDDLPVAAVDAGAASPVIYYVHTDHLQRPVAMTNASQSIAWSAGLYAVWRGANDHEAGQGGSGYWPESSKKSGIDA